MVADFGSISVLRTSSKKCDADALALRLTQTDLESGLISRQITLTGEGQPGKHGVKDCLLTGNQVNFQ